MPLPRESVGFSVNGARRVAIAAERTERFDRSRYNGTGPARSHRQVPRPRAGYVVRVTGQPSGGDPELFPALVIDFDGYSAGTLFWQDGEACWVVRCQGDTGGIPTDTETTAERVGVNYDDGLLIFAVAAGAGDPYPLQELPCLLGAPTNVLGLAQFWFDPVTGVGECRTSGFCGCPPDAPPDPETSCCPWYYCDTVLGVVEVTADGDGLYHPPADWDGEPPHLTEAAAEAVCGLRWWCMPGNAVPVEAPLSSPPAGYTDGPFDTEAEANDACPLLLFACTTEYPRVITFTFSGYSGGCSAWNGSSDLTWDGSKWTGTHVGVTCNLTPTAGFGTGLTFTDSYSGGTYTVGGGSPAAVGCGGYPAGAIRTLTGACTGGGTLNVTA